MKNETHKLMNVPCFTKRPGPEQALATSQEMSANMVIFRLRNATSPFNQGGLYRAGHHHLAFTDISFFTDANFAQEGSFFYHICTARMSPNLIARFAMYSF